MVLEATYLCIDNSDYMRNGDFAPSRMEAQQDAVNLLAGAKTQSNPENSVGVLSMAGKGVEVHAALTSDVGKILSLSHGIKIGGEANLSGGIQVSQLALKHRQNKNQRQRIIVFVGSPIKEGEKDLVRALGLSDAWGGVCRIASGEQHRDTRRRCSASPRPLSTCLLLARAGEAGQEAQEEFGRHGHHQFWRGAHRPALLPSCVIPLPPCHPTTPYASPLASHPLPPHPDSRPPSTSPESLLRRRRMPRSSRPS
tara:strand:- start:522 stop:1283 length:762 start_codon:yes stop_codon:yes gene_type:complete